MGANGRNGRQWVKISRSHPKSIWRLSTMVGRFHIFREKLTMFIRRFLKACTLYLAIITAHIRFKVNVGVFLFSTAPPTFSQTLKVLPFLFTPVASSRIVTLSLRNQIMYPEGEGILSLEVPAGLPRDQPWTPIQRSSSSNRVESRSRI